MSELTNPLYDAHMLLLRWGLEIERREAAEGEELAGTAPSTAADSSEEPPTPIVAEAASPARG